jgi:hypothetical protein
LFLIRRSFQSFCLRLRSCCWDCSSSLLRTCEGLKTGDWGARSRIRCVRD